MNDDDAARAGDDLTRAHDEARREEERLRAQLEAARAATAELRAQAAAELGAWLRLDAALDDGEGARERRRLERQLDELRASPSYRLGDALLEPARGLRDLARRARVALRRPALPPPRPARTDSKYERQGAYHWAYVRERPWYRTRIAAVRDWVAPGASCLDLGCGDGAVAFEVGRRAGRVVGVDGDPLAVRLGTEELTRRGATHVELRAARLRECDAVLGGARFDVVYSLDCIEHLDDPAELLDVMERACRPGGVVIVGTPLFLSEESFSPYHAREFTQAQLEGLLVPRFFTIGSRLLPAPRPDQPGRLDPRYCLWVGRRRRGLLR